MTSKEKTVQPPHDRYIEILTKHDGVDLHRCRAAAHELGHLVVWRAAGFSVAYAEITGHGPSVSGVAHLGVHKCESIEQARAYLVGLHAGEQAEIAWCEQNRMRYDDAAAEGDMERYHDFRKRYRTTFPASIRLADLKTEARIAVRKKWPMIERRILDLAVHGRVR
ncbi:hypothetical protein [Kibdelosporangium aridum]|uniref:hypothetical protein n=1 Tax=Kibdelosporangium aridum TaxID=2030 RepID=UPI000527BC7F